MIQPRNFLNVARVLHHTVAVSMPEYPPAPNPSIYPSHISIANFATVSAK